MAVFAALVNPAFNHEGATILTYLPSGNPLTLESMLYGAAAAVMLASVVLWFSSYNEVMTSDKFVYLFGRVIPALSLVLSMSLRFIPKFKVQMQTVSEAQACIGQRYEKRQRPPPCWERRQDLLHHGHMVARRTPLKLRIPCVPAATACRGARRSPSIVSTTATRPRLRG